VYRRILGPVCDNEKENWRILTNNEIYAMVKKPTITETIRLNRLHWFGHVQRMEENRIPKKVLCMNLETTRLRSRPRNRWQDEVWENGSLVGGKGWKERVITERNWRSSWEWQGIIALCTSQWTEHPIANGLPDHGTQFPTSNNIYTATNILPLKQQTKRVSNEITIKFQILLEK